MPHLNDEHERWISAHVIQLAVLVGVLFAVFVAMDMLMSSCFHDAWSGVFMMNIVVAQLTLICIWGTLVEGTFWIRLPWTILLLVISWGALCYGVKLDHGVISSAEVWGMGLVWVYGFVVSYIPLKLAAWLFGWRIFQKDKPDRGAQVNRYAIRDMMMGTAILAVTLAIGRQFMPGDWPTWSAVLTESGLDDPLPVFAMVLFSIISLIVKLPCIWIALAISKEKIPRYSLIWIVCAGVLGFVELGILAAVVKTLGRSETLQFMFGLVLGHLAMAVIMIGVLCVLRRFGYRTSRLKQQSIEAS